MHSPRQVAARRGKKIGDIMAGREGKVADGAAAETEENEE
jgi:hypothetical protein